MKVGNIMEDELKLNTKLFAFNGIIGRRDYIINTFIITMISQLFTSPLFFGKMQSLDFNNSFFMQINDCQKILIIISTVICTILSFSNMTRRLSDILRKKVDFQIYIICIVFFILSLSLTFFPVKSVWLFYLILSVFSIFLMIKKGEITGKYPIDTVKRFNWGAFFGTWIWGLFNKTFITLWEIPLLLTPVGWFTFPLICGLKGNEWAYQNKQYSDVEAFHKLQKRQTLIFSTIIIIGSILFTLLLTAASVGVLTSYLTKKENKVKFEHKLNNFVENSAHKYFTQIELTKGENKVYMNPVVWKNLDLKEKMNVYKLAYTYTMSKKAKAGLKIYPKLEMEKTTIYSEYNGEVLAKFKPEAEDKDVGFIKAMKKTITDYHFNYNPKIPPQSSK